MTSECLHVADMAAMNEKENYMCLANGDSDDDFRPPRKKKPGQRKPSDRFGSTSTENEMAEITKGYTPTNTKRSTNWALGVFNEWRAARISEYGSCPPSLLEKPIVDELNKWIPRFVNEVRRQEGEYYLIIA